MAAKKVVQKTRKPEGREIAGSSESAENTNVVNQDQPRSSPEMLPKAHKDKERGNKRPEGVPTREDTNVRRRA
jgi:hypothetical protein